MYFRKAVAERIKELLSVFQWTAYKLAMLSGLSTSTLDNILHGRCKSCNADSLLNICRAFNMELVEFLNSKLFLLENLSDDD